MIRHLGANFLAQNSPHQPHNTERSCCSIFKGFQLIHFVFFAVAAVGFFIFWSRTRFWLPKYAHMLAAIALLVGIWCASTIPGDAPVSKQGPIAKLLLALALPAMVYFFFVFYGGQKAAFRRKPKSATEIANIIERFLNHSSMYPAEWNDFVSRTHPDTRLESYRKRCADLTMRIDSSMWNSQNPKAQTELRSILHELRTL